MYFRKSVKSVEEKVPIVTYTLDVNLCVLVYSEVSAQPQPSPLPLPIHPHPIPCPISCPSPSHHQEAGATLAIIIPPGVPFKLPCPICQCPLE